MKNKGFTLIELLVVIAIIGILSSVVLASLNTARNKGTDAAIKSQLAAIRPQAEIYYDTNSGYTTGGTFSAGDCVTGTVTGTLFGDTTIANQLKSVKSAAGSIVCAASSSAWAVSAPLKTSGYWCADSAGASKSQAGNITTGSCL